MIECQRVGGYLYYIANPEAIDENRLKKWMLDSFSVGNVISENLSLTDRILVEEIPSGRDHLTTILEAMREDQVIMLSYKGFGYSCSYTFPVEPYCVKLNENRWYMLGYNRDKKYTRLYSLDRIDNIEVTDEKFNLPKDFNASDYFRNYYGIVIGDGTMPTRIVLRANKNHKSYLKSLPLHHSQRLLKDNGEYADFELYLAQT